MLLNKAPNLFMQMQLGNQYLHFKPVNSTKSMNNNQMHTIKKSS